MAFTKSVFVICLSRLRCESVCVYDCMKIRIKIMAMRDLCL